MNVFHAGLYSLSRGLTASVFSHVKYSRFMEEPFSKMMRNDPNPRMMLIDLIEEQRSELAFLDEHVWELDSPILIFLVLCCRLLE
jgi:hypothetical protein